MARVRIELFFVGMDAGWSENIHSQLGPDNITGIDAQVNALINARVVFLNKEFSIINVRVSDDDAFRDIVIPRPLVPIRGQIDNLAIHPNNCYLLRMQSSPRIFRNYYAHGLSVSSVDGRMPRNGSDTLAGAKAFRDYLLVGQYGISAKPSTNAKVLVKAFNAGTGIFTMYQNVTGLTDGGSVVLTRVPRSIVPARTFRVAEFVDASHFSLIGWNSAVDISNQGYFQNAAKTVQALTATRVGAATFRKVGRPFDVLHGRAPIVR